MRPVPAVPRVLAIRDAQDATDYYITGAGDRIAYRFIDAILTAYSQLGDNPEIGSRRLGEALGLNSLRTWPLRGFPYVVCYEVGANSVDVWRVLHAHSDLPKHLVSIEV